LSCLAHLTETKEIDCLKGNQKMVKPIFIIGCPRSGTTMALNIIARHEELAWISNGINRYPLQLSKARINRIYDLPFMGDFLYLTVTQEKRSRALPDIVRRLLPFPVEPWSFWNSYLHNFQWERGGAISPRRRTEHDISSNEIIHLRKAIETICKYQNKRRFLSKYTDFPRITYLTQVFPDAIFIHIVRDGRAVAASYLEKINKGEFGTWNEREWWIKGWPQSWREEWINQYNTPLSFVAFQWKYFVNEIWEDAKNINKKHYMEVHYKDLVDNPHPTFNRIFEFCGLSQSKRVESYLDKMNLNSRDYRWKEKFSDEEKALLTKITGDGKYIYLLNNDD